MLLSDTAFSYSCSKKLVTYGKTTLIHTSEYLLELRWPPCINGCHSSLNGKKTGSALLSPSLKWQLQMRSFAYVGYLSTRLPKTHIRHISMYFKIYCNYSLGSIIMAFDLRSWCHWFHTQLGTVNDTTWMGDSYVKILANRYNQLPRTTQLSILPGLAIWGDQLVNCLNRSPKRFFARLLTGHT